ncbi:hypothetical protein HN51_043909 [Arachis hypogaea]
MWVIGSHDIKFILRGSGHHSGLLLVLSCVAHALHYCKGLAHPIKPKEGGAGLVKEQALLLEPSDGKEKKKRRGMAQGQRSAYQMFLKQECTQLKSCNSTSTGKGILHTAIDS